MVTADSSLSPHASTNTAGQGRSQIAVFVLIAVAVASIARWSIWGEELELRAASVLSCARLLLASCILMLVGAATTNVALRSAKIRELISVSIPIPTVSRAILFLVAGQLVSMVWIFLRSGISSIAYGFLGRRLPITLTELVVLFAALATSYQIGRRRLELNEVQSRALRLNTGGVVGTVLLLVCALLPLALRELPRSIALSSDPDQHAYWAHQIVRLGGIPWEQGIFGDEPFGYPAGFAVLNALWMLFSGLSAVEIVTVQPMIQCLLAVLLCGAVAPICLSMLQRRAATGFAEYEVVISCLLLLGCYWFLLPFGNQTNRYLGSGTARLSTSLLSALVLLGWILFPSRMVSHFARRIRLIVFAIATAFVATFNPMSALLPLLVTSLTAARLLIDLFARSKRQGDFNADSRWLSFGLCISPLLLVFCDPYFSKPLTGAIKDLLFGGVPRSSGGLSFAALSHVTTPSQPIWDWLNPAQMMRLFLAGTRAEMLSSFGSGLLFLVAAVTWFFAFPVHAKRFAALLATALCLLWLADGLHLSDFQDAPLYLVQPYIIQSLWDCGVLFGCLCISGLITGAFAFLSKARAVAFLTFVVVLSLISPRSGAQLNSQMTLSPRVATCGSFGCVTANDAEVFRFVKKFGAGVLTKYSNLDFANAPKILILGHPAIHGPEKWVFPYGASRVLPQESPLPVAFFYGQGSKAWTYENYMERICSQFDRDWLRSHNIRYLFLPESNPGCLRGRERVLGEMTVLFESGSSKFMQIFPDKGLAESSK